MKIFAMIILIAIIAVALVPAVLELLPAEARSAALLMPVTLTASAGAGAVIRLMLARFASHWSARRSVVIAAGAVPLLLWLLAVGFDVAVVIERHRHPEESLMGGMTIVAFIPCAMSFGASLAGAVLATVAINRAR